MISDATFEECRPSAVQWESSDVINFCVTSYVGPAYCTLGILDIITTSLVVLIRSHTLMMFLSDWSLFYPVKKTPLNNNCFNKDDRGSAYAPSYDMFLSSAMSSLSHGVLLYMYVG